MFTNYFTFSYRIKISFKSIWKTFFVEIFFSNWIIKIFISAFDSSPLSADYDFITADYKKNILTAIDYLRKLTSGSINISIRKESESFLRELDFVKIYNVTGPHP